MAALASALVCAWSPLLLADEPPTPEKPTPEKPAPEKPAPEKPAPDKPAPAKPAPETAPHPGGAKPAPKGSANVDDLGEIIDDPDEGIPRPAAEDLLTGHFLIALGGGLVAPSSDLFPDLDGVGHPAVGAGAGLRLGVGVARAASIDLAGGFAWLGGGDICDGCRSYAFDAGLGLTYHVVQGIAFDPWVSYGVGYRHLLLSLPDSTERYHGVDFARLGVGADFFPSPAVGVGPFLETDIGVRLGEDRSVYALFELGVRVAFDPMRADVSLAPASASAR